MADVRQGNHLLEQHSVVLERLRRLVEGVLREHPDARILVGTDERYTLRIEGQRWPLTAAPPESE
jgi:hypothetical protein